jgi:hypothetical protein
VVARHLNRGPRWNWSNRWRTNKSVNYQAISDLTFPQDFKKTISSQSYIINNMVCSSRLKGLHEPLATHNSYTPYTLHTVRSTHAQLYGHVDHLF